MPNVTCVLKKLIVLNWAWHLPPSASQNKTRSIPSLNGPTLPFNFWPSESVIMTSFGGTVNKTNFFI